MSSMSGAHVMRDQGVGWDVRLVNKINNFARVGKKYFGARFVAAILILRFPVLQGTWETSSVDHTEIQSLDSDCDPIINPYTHVLNGFLHFLCHNLTQIR